ncbi:phage terminase large subunit family protein [Acuticoccus mangrovi]|uniref:phage terminase large subunit family protein n=1 Tax=Acuticoccus mangrovi TaxID=2796142 RepID=UPI001B3BF47D|nr:phage terminase large subunit family protein [Acuticoccus mangrovi]
MLADAGGRARPEADADLPLDLAIKRTATFRGRRKIYMVSTATLKGHSRIEAAFKHSDRRFYHISCRIAATWSRSPRRAFTGPRRGATRRI